MGDGMMKRLLISFLALALCPPAQAWEQFHPHTGYKYCVENVLRIWVSKSDWDSLSARERLRKRGEAHQQCN